jgi:hypothetical protein
MTKPVRRLHPAINILVGFGIACAAQAIFLPISRRQVWAAIATPPCLSQLIDRRV